MEYFDRSVAEGKGEPIAEDACFWRVVSRDRAGQDTGAVAELKDFLRKYPQSSRNGEVSVMLGWKLVERGDYKTAKRLFESAVEDSEHRVRNSVAQGLEMLRKNKYLETTED